MRITYNRKTLLTAPNAISLLGFLLVVAGSLRLQTYPGLALVAAGRLADVADGLVARRLHQTTAFGATLDLTLDKLAGLAIFIALWSGNMAPKWALCAIFIQNALNIVATALAQRAHPDRKMLPSIAGKFAMGLQSGAMVLYAAAFVFGQAYPDAGQGLYYLAHACVISGVGYFGVKATYGYFKRIY